jgi:lactoylglutathione lyase
MTDASHLQGVDLRLRHTMLPVADLNRSVKFYTDMLGMNVMRKRVNDVKKHAVAYVGYGAEDTDTCLELIEDISANPPAKMNRWHGHIAIAVTGLYGICEHLEKAGVKFTQAAGPVAPNRKDLVAFLIDPDGYEIELTEHMSGNPGIAS